jgi:transcriptional regulator with XRE-family HTH domain
MELKDKIQELRKCKKLSQENLAEKLNISRQAVAKWENGETYPDINNLIGLSNIFNISIDRLLKDDDCMSIIEKEYDMSEIISFLIIAKKNTYAGNTKEEEVSTRPNSHDLIYKDGKYKYIDTYLGGERFIGEEALFIDDEAVWAMNYNGIEINEKFSSNFLKKALSTVNTENPYRGQNKFQDGDYTYICETNGNFEYFNGKEIIYFQNEKVFECNFSGGIIK